MYDYNYEIARRHIQDMQAASEQYRVAKDARQARPAISGNLLRRWLGRPVPARKAVRARRAELVRQEWEV